MKFKNYQLIFITLLVYIFLGYFTECFNKAKFHNLADSKLKIKNTEKNQFEFRKSKFEFSKFEFDTRIFKKFYSKNDTLQASLYRDLNESFVVTDSRKFIANNQNWDYKILDHQLEEIFSTLLWKHEDRLTVPGMRNYMEIFMNKYQLCDKDKDNVLSLEEFKSCLTTDPYFAQVVPPPEKYAASTSYTDKETFQTTIFKILDERLENYINFVGYMRLRLMVYSWRECSVFAPFLEEADFECALEIAAGFKTISRKKARNIFKLILELSNNPSLRNIDFISFLMAAHSAHLYGMINGKEDDDITRSEFNLALDDNILPICYNQDIINNLFQLIDEYDKPNQGIDLMSFMFYDFVLRLCSFDKKERPYYLSESELMKVFQLPLFPNKTLSEIYFIPQYKLTAESYQTYQYFNVSHFVSEGDYLYKFLELETKISTKDKKHNFVASPFLSADKNLYNIPISLNETNNLIFSVLDFDLDGWINFYEFGSFMQIAYTFAAADTYNKGRISAGALFELFKYYAETPALSFRIRERAERFSLFEQNLYIDLLSAVQIMKIDDIAKYYFRKSDTSTVYEVELKKMLTRVNMRYLPNPRLHPCNRGYDYKNLPKYDWECCFLVGMKMNLEYFETMNNYKEVQLNKLSITDSVFYNVDPNYT